MRRALIDDTIGVRPCASCHLCGAEGELIYQGLSDGLFGAAGEWNLKICSNPECRLVWLDPMPLEEDIGKAYATYYTHSERQDGNKGLKEIVISNLLRAYGAIWGEQKTRSLTYLDKVAPGRLLEVGCGNGSLLARMQAAGWKVEGQEVDAEAVAYARNAHDFPVHVGPLEELAFSEATFDAIIMAHVIEHVSDPTALLAECRRILKPKGTLVAVTPNVESFGHRRFREDWRGLEPPRHLHLFSSSSLYACARKAGYGSINVRTSPAAALSMLSESRDIRRKRMRKTKRRSPLGLALDVGFQFWERLSDAGEEVVLKVVK